MTSKRPRPIRRSRGARTRTAEPSAGHPAGSDVPDADATSATFGYLGAIFIGPVIPLIVYATRARRSPFLRCTRPPRSTCR